jgi:hypothetical protein
MWRKRITFCSVHNLSSTLSKLPYCHTLREEHATALMYSRVRVFDSGYLSVGPSFEKISITPSCPAVHRRMHKVIYTRQTGDGNKHDRRKREDTLPLCRSCNPSRNGVSDCFCRSLTGNSLKSQQVENLTRNSLKSQQDRSPCMHQMFEYVRAIALYIKQVLKLASYYFLMLQKTASTCVNT